MKHIKYVYTEIFVILELSDAVTINKGLVWGKINNLKMDINQVLSYINETKSKSSTPSVQTRQILIYKVTGMMVILALRMRLTYLSRVL